MTRWRTWRPGSGRRLALLGLAGMMVGASVTSLGAQQAAPADSVDCTEDAQLGEPGRILDAYVAEGLRSNLALRQQELGVERAEARVSEARSAYLPAVRVDARFSRADGGRSFDIPVGDLVNPIYDALGDLSGQPGAFPTVQNEQVRFLRGQEQDTRLRVTQLLFSPAVRHDIASQKHAERAEQAGRDGFRRATVRDIKVAYFRYVNAQRAVEILADAYDRVVENERSSQRLVDAELATLDRVYRARAERLEVEQQQAQARVDEELARSNFNFLLNRDPRAPIEIDRALLAQPVWRDTPVRRSEDEPAGDFEAFIDSLSAVAVHRRDEIRQVNAAAAAAESGASAARTSVLPSLVLAVDAGIQGADYGLGAEQRYVMGSLLLQWDVFSGGGNRARARQAEAEAGRLRVRRDEIERQIRLEVETAGRNALVALRSLDTAEQRVQEATRSFRLVTRRQEEGLATALEFLDARAALTQAELNLSITQASFLVRLAELDYAVGPWEGDDPMNLEQVR